MPVVKMPDGTQVRFPDEMPREQIRDMIVSKFPDAAQQTQNDFASALADQRKARPVSKLSAMRQRYPQYDDMTDQQFADAFHQKFYSDMPQADFYSKIGMEGGTDKPVTLTINGTRVKVDSSFMQLSSEQQNATVDEIAASIGAMGTNPQSQGSMTLEQRKAIALASGRLRLQNAGNSGQDGNNGVGPAAPVTASSVFADEMLFGLPGKASAALNAAIRAPFTDKSFTEEYDSLRGAYNHSREQYAEENPAMNTAATIGGQLYGAGKLAPASLTRLVPQTTSAIGRFAGMTAGSAADGLLMGAASAYGHDQDVGSGALIGGALGAASYPAVQTASAALRPIGSFFGIGNNARAQSYVNEALKRSGNTAGDIAAMITGARADGQGMFTVADAMGNSGQRALAGVARSPGDMRQVIAETLDARQAGQGRRIANALSEGFDAADTAAQRAARLTAERSTQAAQNYGAARAGSGAVDPTAAINAADDFLTPGASKVFNPGNNIADDSIEAAVRRARGYLTDGNSVLTDFNAAFRAKMELDSMIEGAKPAVQSQLIPIRNALDGALEKASPNYANARNTFRQQSKAIDAIETGRTAATRGRYEDTIPTFNAMSPQEQAAFRAGYSDPLIAHTQGSATGVNKARPLINDATKAEFPAFAAPGRAQQLGDRLAREQTMFETRNAVLGGSKTADNLADMGEAASIDPTMIGNLMTGRWASFAGDVIRHGANAATGRNEAVRDQIAKMLMETNPDAAAQILTSSVKGSRQADQLKERLTRMLMGLSIPAASGLLLN